MGIIRDSFVIYRDWAEGISELSPKNRLACYDALMQFGLTGQFPEDIKNETVRAMLKTFRREMQNNIARYMASVENGKKGGRPKKDQLKEEKEQFSCENENLEKPNITQDNQNKPTHNLNDNVYVNDNVNVIKLVNNKNIFENYKNINACVRVRVRESEERQVYFEKYKTLFDYHSKDKFADAGYEIIDTMIEAKEQSETEKGLVFKLKKYNQEKFEQVLSNISYKQFENIVSQIVFNEEIENRPAYILGCLIEASNQHSGGD